MFNDATLSREYIQPFCKGTILYHHKRHEYEYACFLMYILHLVPTFSQLHHSNNIAEKSLLHCRIRVHVHIPTPMSFGRKRNCLLRLLFSMMSMSVTYTAPSGLPPNPIREKFLRSSQPIAPAPTYVCVCVCMCAHLSKCVCVCV